MRRRGQQDDLCFVERLAQLTTRFDTRWDVVLGKVEAIDVKAVDIFNHFFTARPEADLMPRAPGNYPQRRPPTPRANYCDARHNGNDECAVRNEKQEAYSLIPHSALRTYLNLLSAPRSNRPMLA